VWCGDGSTLFFRHDGAVNAASVQVDPLEAGPPQPIFEGAYDRGPPGHQHYDVSRDGEAFLMIREGSRPRPERLQRIRN